MQEKERDTVFFELDPENLPKLTSEQEARLDAMGDEDIDYSDIPDHGDDDAFWARAVKMPRTKQGIFIRLDADVLDWFKGQGPGYQTRMNAVLRSYMEHHG